MTDEASLYRLAIAVDLLDDLVQGGSPSVAAVVRGAIALALHDAGSADGLAVVRDLELLALEARALDGAGLERAARVATRLRRAVGVH